LLKSWNLSVEDIQTLQLTAENLAIEIELIKDQHKTISIDNNQIPLIIPPSRSEDLRSLISLIESIK